MNASGTCTMSVTRVLRGETSTMPIGHAVELILASWVDDATTLVRATGQDGVEVQSDTLGAGVTDVYTGGTEFSMAVLSALGHVLDREGSPQRRAAMVRLDELRPTRHDLDRDHEWEVSYVDRHRGGPIHIARRRADLLMAILAGLHIDDTEDGASAKLNGLDQALAS